MVVSSSYKIESDRLFLRFPSIDDIPGIFSATKFKGFNDGMLWDAPNTPEELVQPFQNSIVAWQNGDAYSFSIINKTDNLFIGRISVRKELPPATWSLGFWMHPEHQNKGYMTEATTAIILFGFEQLFAEKIVADHAVWNRASEAVLKKCGLAFSTYIEKGFKKNGAWIAENRLEITRAAWLKKHTQGFDLI